MSGSEFVYVRFVYFVHLCAIVHMGLGNTVILDRCSVYNFFKAMSAIKATFRNVMHSGRSWRVILSYRILMPAKSHRNRSNGHRV